MSLKIKIEVLDFINDINILVYDRFTEEICKTLSKAHDVCANELAFMTQRLHQKSMNSRISLENRRDST